MTTARRKPGRRRRWAAIAIALTLALGGGAAQGQLAPERSHDASLPIEITSDTLEVQHDSQVAVFRGNVDAVQGDLILRADQLTVHYQTGEDGKNTIASIDAEGNVFVSTPNEMAQGDRGRYDVASDTIELIGAVVLSREQTVIRGERMTLNLATGKSKMESGLASQGGTGRVKALFVPKSTRQ